MAQNRATPKNFEFPKMYQNFPGYNSANDPTKLDPSIMVGGSQNVYKKINGNLANRPGKKLYSPADTTSAPVTSEYVWNKSNGSQAIVQVANSKLQALISGTWYDILTGLTTTRWTFSPWFSQAENHDYLMMTATSNTTYSWSGGIGTILRGNNTSISIIGQSGLSGATTITGTAITKVIPYMNSLTDTSSHGSLVGVTNPSNGETLSVTMNGVSGITITFVSVIGATPGNVLIGANIGATMTNLLGLLSAPSTTNANQVALSGPDATAIEKSNYASTNTITLSGTNSWMQNNFTNTETWYTKTVIIGGVDYTYTGGADTLTIYGVSPDPSALTPSSTVIQKATTIPYSSSSTAALQVFRFDFCKTISNQVYYGSYISQTCYVSSSTNPTDFIPSSPAVQGSANVINLDSTLNGISEKNGKPYISVGGYKWGIVNYTYSVISSDNVRQTNIEYTPTSAGSGAYAHEFIDTNGDSIIYLSADQQVRGFGSFNTSFTSNNYPSLSQEIYTELQAEIFSNDTYTGNLRCIGDYIYLTSPISGLTYLYQARQAVNSNNQVIVERLWHAPMTWNLTRVDIINNTVLGFSNTNPQIYQLWDTNIYYDEDPTGDTFPYTSILKFAYDGTTRRQGLWSFDKVFTEGYINPDTTLSLTVNYDDQGLTASYSQEVNSSQYQAYIFSSEADSLGDSSLGDSSFGMGGDESSDSMVRFKNINQFPLENSFEWQLTYQTENSGDQWEISAKATNERVEDEQQPIFIINKQ